MTGSNGQPDEEPVEKSVTTIAEIATDALGGMLSALNERELTCEAVLVLAPPGDEHEVLVLQMLEQDAKPQVRGTRILEFAIERIRATPEKFQEMEDPNG